MAFYHIIFRVWFALTVLVAIIIMWLQGQLVYRLSSAPLLDKQRRCKSFVRLAFRGILLFNPWIRISYDDAQWQPFRDAKAASGRGSVVIINHTSFMDAIIYTAMCPADVLPNCCTLAKKELFHLPLFGTTMRLCGHLPVPFVGKEEGNFAVDRAAMESTLRLAEEHLTRGNTLVVFPEGQLNRDPRKVQVFRRGSFQLALQHNVSIWGCCIRGCDITWPRYMAIGGLPARIEWKVWRIIDHCADLPIEDLTAKCQDEMQQAIDTLYARP